MRPLPRLLCIAGVVVAMLGGSRHGFAYNLSGEYWRTSPILMNLQLGPSNGPLLDGFSSWGASAEDALAAWNASMKNMQFSVVRDSTAAIAQGNGINNVFWSNTIYGQAWGARTLAITLTRYATAKTYTETDVIFNSNLSFDSYRGPLRTQPNGSTLNDFHRVALHEFGHALGLNHPDDVGQVVTAQMNSTISSLDALAADDLAGVKAIYDSGSFVDTGGLQFSGSVGYSYVGSALTLNVASIKNTKPTGTSGTIRLELWAEPAHYSNGLVTGSYMMGSYTLPSVLAGGSSFGSGSYKTTLTMPPTGTYFIVMLLCEFTGASSDNGYAIRDNLEFSNPLVVGSGSVAPSISVPPAPLSVRVGASATFSVTAGGTGPFTYQWLKNGTAIPGATSSSYTISGVQATDAGTYAATVTNIIGSTTSSAAALAVNTTRLTNVSVRSSAGAGSQTLIVGIVVSGSGSKQMLLRGIGPSLGLFGVTGVLADPQLSLFNASSVQITQNAGWGGSAALAAAFTSVGAFNLPGNSRDAALLVPLIPGNYSAQLASASAGKGVALVEGYDLDAAVSGTRFTNVSVRSVAGSGTSTLIVGFAVDGTGAENLLIRAVGPTLSLFGVTGLLADPQLQLFDSAGNLINQNDNWGGGAALVSAFTSVGAFNLPAASLDSALLVTLPPGTYTAQVLGAGNSTGVALVEVYELP